MSRSLAQVLSGESGTVSGIDERDELSCRLYELGFGIGSPVLVEQAGNPCIVRVGGGKVAMSRDLLDRVRIS